MPSRKQNLLASYRLGEILRSLSGTDINVIVLKGMALAKTVYQDIAPRPFGDIDLLVHRRDINKVESKLLQLGYILSSGEHVSFANQFGAALRYKNNGVMPVDLHWYVIELPYSKYIDTNSFWEDPVCIDIEGVNALVFSPENLLIHLCLHVIKEHYSQILWLVDIAEVIHRYGNILDWELVQKKSEQYRINMLIYQVLNTLDELFAVPIPISVQECSGRFKSSSFEARLFGALADPKLTRHERMGIARFLNLYRTRFKIKRVLDEFLPDRDFMSKKYPRKKICISYYTRVQLAFRMVFGFIRALSRL